MICVSKILFFQWLSGIVALQTSIACHLSSKKRKLSEASESIEKGPSDVKSETSNEVDFKDIGIKKKHVASEDENFKDDTPKLKLNNALVNGVLNNHEQSCSDDTKVSDFNNSDCINGTSIPSRSSLISPKIQNGESDSLPGIDAELSEDAENL